MKLLTGILMLIFSLTALKAQETRQTNVRVQGVKATAEIIGTSSPKVVRGAPFSAEAVSESVQILADGNKLTQIATARMYRDSEGRFRREQLPNLSGNLGSFINIQQTISILDPVAGMQFLLNPSLKTANRLKLETSNPKVTTGQAQLETTVKTLKNQVNVQPNPVSPINPDKTESLGVREIEGVKAVGTRSTKTIAAGELGNDRAFDIVYERWYSDELQEIILSKHTDPRFGVQTYRLINIKRNEPERRLFTPPADYKISDSKAFTYQITKKT